MALFTIEPTPLTIPGAVLWMRPDDTRSSNMTASVNRLSAIKNLANNRLLIQNPVSSNQPGTGVSTINGLNAIQFDNDNNRWLTTGLSTMTNSTFFIVIQKFIANTQGLISGSDQIMRPTFNDTAGFISNDGTTSITTTSGASLLTTPAILGITCDAASSTRNLYKSSLTINISGGYDGSYNQQFFGTQAASSGSARGGYNQGETVIYNRVLTSTEITKIMRYLANRWGIILT